jgi:hypothetical protein
VPRGLPRRGREGLLDRRARNGGRLGAAATGWAVLTELRVRRASWLPVRAEGHAGAYIRLTFVGGRAIMPTPPDNVLLSPDGRHWWDGTRWIHVADALPPNALSSPDGSQWWDGTSWKPVRSEPASEYDDADYEDSPPDEGATESRLTVETIRAAPGGLIAIVGGLALVLGAFLPWLSYSAVFVGPSMRRGSAAAIVGRSSSLPWQRSSAVSERFAVKPS